MSVSQVSADQFEIFSAGELVSVEAWLGEALSSIAADDPDDAADCIERAMAWLGLR